MSVRAFNTKRRHLLSAFLAMLGDENTKPVLKGLLAAVLFSGTIICVVESMPVLSEINLTINQVYSEKHVLKAIP